MQITHEGGFRMIQFIVRGHVENPPKEFRALNDHYIADYEELGREERKVLKQKYPQGYFRLQFWEEGGGTFEGGNATIVCGLNGEKLKPVKIKQKGWLANSRHALFVGNSLCRIQVSLEARNYKFSLIRYSIKAKIGVLEEEILWVGSRHDLEDLPEELKVFSEAFEAATKKVQEYRCIYPLYILKEDA